MANKRIAVVLILVFLFSMSVHAADDLPLATPGPYAVGVKIMRFQDMERDKLVVTTNIWYPALVGADGKVSSAPDLSGAPYPLVIYSHDWSTSAFEAIETGLVQALVSQGFVVAAMNHSGESSFTSKINRPLDIQFVLNQLAALNDGILVGVIDTDHVGVVGNSFGAYTAIMAAGARLDMLRTQTWMNSSSEWEEFSQYASRFALPDSNGLWSLLADERIRAVMPIAGLYDEVDLAAISKPVFFVSATGDEFAPYQSTIDAFEHMSAADHYLLTLVGEDHYFPISPAIQPALAHFAVAYFGYYLQDKQDYASYLSADYINSLTGYDNLVWGAYSGE